MKRAIALMILTLTGCKITDNLGDGKVAGVVPVSVISAGAAAAGHPGVAAGIEKGEAILAALRKTQESGLPPPQFGAMSSRTNITVLLTNGTWIASSEIAKIRKEIVPIPPAPLVEEFSPSEIVQQVAVGKKRTQDINEVVQAVAAALMQAGIQTPPPAQTNAAVVDTSDLGSVGVLDPAIEEALRKRTESRD